MIKNCDGCEEELNMAIEWQDSKDYALATGDGGTSGLEEDDDVTHLTIVMVDNAGNIVIS